MLREALVAGDRRTALWLWLAGRIERAPAGIAEPSGLIITGDFPAAAQQWAEKGCPHERAIALSCGDTAAQLEALDILDTLGATAVAAGLRKQMRNRGITVDRGKGAATERHPVGLTARQDEILTLLAEGLSNL